MAKSTCSRSAFQRAHARSAAVLGAYVKRCGCPCGGAKPKAKAAKAKAKAGPKSGSTKTKQWIFDWSTGGGNMVHAKTRGEALRLARKLGRPLKLDKRRYGVGKTKGLTVNAASMRPMTAADYRSSRFWD